MIENIRKGENKLDFSKFVFVDQWKMKVRIGDLSGPGGYFFVLFLIIALRANGITKSKASNA